MASIKSRNGGWTVRWRDPDGSSRRRQFKKNYAAKQHLKEVQDAEDRGHRWEPYGLRSVPEIREAIKAALFEWSPAVAYATLESRAYTLEWFAQWLYEDHGSKRKFTVDQLDRELLRKWYDSTAHLGQRTRIQRLGIAWQFVDFLFQEYPDDIRSFRRIKVRHPAATPRQAPTIEEEDACILALEEFSKNARRSSKVFGVWKAAVLMRFTGLRSGQVVRLRWKDFDLDDQALIVRPELGKSRQERAGRRIPISSYLSEMMTSWGRREGEVVNVHQSTLPKWLGRAWRASGVPKEKWQGGSAHRFRAGFETFMTTSRVRAIVIDHLLGHSMGVRHHYMGQDALFEEGREAVALLPEVGQSKVIAFDRAINTSRVP